MKLTRLSNVIPRHHGEPDVRRDPAAVRFEPVNPAGQSTDFAAFTQHLLDLVASNLGLPSRLDGGRG